MPAHIPASIGKGALPLVEKINNGKASKLDQVITDQPARPAALISINLRNWISC